jgi:hypothetical protein
MSSKEELAVQLRGIAVGELSAGDAGRYCDEICKVTGQTKPAQIGKKRLMIENFLADFAHVGAAPPKQPPQAARNGGDGGRDQLELSRPSTAAAVSLAPVDVSELATIDLVVGAIAARMAASGGDGPLAATDVTALAGAIAKLAGNKPPSSLGAKRVYVTDFFSIKGGMACAAAQHGIARARAASEAASRLATAAAGGGGMHARPSTPLRPTSGGAADYDSPGAAVSLAAPGGAELPSRAELFEMVKRAVVGGRGWLRSDAEARQLAGAIRELTEMPIGPDPAQYVADWWNWMRWASGTPLEPRASRPRAAGARPGTADSGLMAMYQQQQLQAQALYQQAQQQMMQQQMMQQQQMMLSGLHANQLPPMPQFGGENAMQAAMLGQLQQQQQQQLSQSHMAGAMGFGGRGASGF